MENQKQTTNFLLTESVGKLIIKFSVPCVLSMLVSALYNIVDQIFIGQKIGYLGNAATTVVYPFTVIALALALLIGDGSAALLSLSLGRNDSKTSHRCIGNAIIFTIAVGIILTIVGFTFMDSILKLFGVTEASYQYAKEYMQIILLGIPFYMFVSSMNSAIRADGAPSYAMCATVLGAIINLVLDPIAIFILNMGVKGAAIATIIGQIASCIMTLLYFRNTKSFHLQKNSFRLNTKVIKNFCQLGISSFITQIAIVVISCIANNICNIYGQQSIYGPDIPLSALGIVFKVFGIVIAFSVGIAVGGQPIIGYNYGAGNYNRVKKTYYFILFANLIVGFIAMMLFELYPQTIVNLFGNESTLYNKYACMCFRIYLGGILLCCLQKASSIFLQSIGKPIKAAILSLSRDVLFLLPSITILAYYFGIDNMLWAGPFSDILSFILTAVVIILEIKLLSKKIDNEYKLSPSTQSLSLADGQFEKNN